jgi:hypothetical protein
VYGIVRMTRHHSAKARSGYAPEELAYASLHNRVTCPTAATPSPRTSSASAATTSLLVQELLSPRDVSTTTIYTPVCETSNWHIANRALADAGLS